MWWGGAREPDSGLPAHLPTLGKVFQQNGYATALFGKWHVGFQDEYNPVHHGFDEFIGLLNGAGDFHVEDDWRNGLQPFTMRGYATDKITNDSIDFIARHQGEPFFLVVSHQTPHNPYQTRADTPESRQAGWRQNRVSDENRPRYIEMLKDLDNSVGAILDQLQATGLTDNTLIFFLSDNGDVGMSPVERKLRGTKFGHYEGGHRVPAVAWWPGKIPAATESDAFLLGFDLFPTFTEVAGISGDNPNNLDGRSFADHLLDQAPVPQRDIFFGYEPKLGTAMRRGPWKMILNEDDVQLYNLDKYLKKPPTSPAKIRNWSSRCAQRSSTSRPPSCRVHSPRKRPSPDWQNSHPAKYTRQPVACPLAGRPAGGCNNRNTLKTATPLDKRAHHQQQLPQPL